MINGKTTHGLLRHSERFDIVAVTDAEHGGQDTRSVLGTDIRSVPIFSSLAEFLGSCDRRPDFCITGIATHGGVIPDSLRTELIQALDNKISVINGLHQFLHDDPEIVALAKKNHVTIHDIRRPKHRSELRFWNGDIDQVTCPIIAVLGTDCALGKRTTAQWLVGEARTNNCNAQMIYTGQTGWLQGSEYGFIFDSTTNDFVSGELEGAIVSCWENESPELIVLEGQSSLRNPSGPCGSEFILSGKAKGVVLQHAPRREFYDGYEELGYRIPSIKSEIELIRSYGAEVFAITLNTADLTSEETELEQKKIHEELSIPVVAVREQGCAEVFNAFKDWAR